MARGSDAKQQSGKHRKKKQAELVGRVIKKIEEKLERDELKPSMGDFIRLLQLEKELEEEEQPREIKVSWIEPDESKDASAK